MRKVKKDIFKAYTKRISKEMALGEILEKISKRLKTLDERQLFYQSIAVKPITGKREADYERTEHFRCGQRGYSLYSPE